MKTTRDKYPNISDNKTCPITPVNVQDGEKFKPINEKAIDVKDTSYEISNKGRLYKMGNKGLQQIKGSYDKDGYHITSLRCKDGKSHRVGFHKLVLSAFYDTPDFKEKGLMPNHLDGNVVNNDIENLDWRTDKENAEHAMELGLHKMNGTDNPNNKLTENDVREICRLIETGEYYDTEIATKFGVSYTNISDIHKQKIWTNISKDYDMSVRKKRNWAADGTRLDETKVHHICKMIDDGYDNQQIAVSNNTTAKKVNDIRTGTSWRSISLGYNFSKNSNYK